MPEYSLSALFLIGFLGGVHCIGMCGGIVGALSVETGPRASLHLAYNAGRLLSYALAGAMAGAIGEVGMALSAQLPVRLLLSFLANLMLIGLGLYLAGLTQVLGFAERFGHRLWCRLQPYGRRFLPVRRVSQAFPLGMLWGWLPCGLVYSALVYSLASGSALNGALQMLCFGLGTLPNLLLAGLLLARLKVFTRNRGVRIVSGAIVLGYGIWGMTDTLRMVLPTTGGV